MLHHSIYIYIYIIIYLLNVKFNKSIVALYYFNIFSMFVKFQDSKK